MTRTYRHAGVGDLHGARGVADFTIMSSDQAVRRVRELRARGWAEQTIATACGWSVIDVRRALAPATAGEDGHV